MIDEELMQEIRKRDRTSPQNIYQKFARVRRKYTVSNKLAALIHGETLNINISKYATPAELSEIRDAKAKLQQSVIQSTKTQLKRSRRTYIFKFGSEFETDDPVLPIQIAEEADAMAKLYPYVYAFENSVRNIICIVMHRKHGKNWWKNRVGARIKRDVERNKTTEKKNAWHGKWKPHDIYYTELDDLRSIIASNPKIFEGITPPLNVLEGFFREMEMSRNTIAHNNPLEKDDVERLKLNYRSWIRQIKASTIGQVKKELDQPT